MLGRPRYISETCPSGFGHPKCLTLVLGRLPRFSHGTAESNGQSPCRTQAPSNPAATTGLMHALTRIEQEPTPKAARPQGKRCRRCQIMWRTSTCILQCLAQQRLRRAQSSRHRAAQQNQASRQHPPAASILKCDLFGLDPTDRVLPARPAAGSPVQGRCSPGGAWRGPPGGAAPEAWGQRHRSP
jgi:hypothetical protein